MFIDENILKIVQRASGLKPEDAVLMIRDYTNLVLELIATVGIDYNMEKRGLVINSQSDVTKFLDKYYKELLLPENKEILQKIKMEMEEIDMRLVKEFAQNANPGDVMYLKVYLASRIKEMRDNKERNKKTEYKIEDDKLKSVGS